MDTTHSHSALISACVWNVRGGGGWEGIVLMVGYFSISFIAKFNIVIATETDKTSMKFGRDVFLRGYPKGERE